MRFIYAFLTIAFIFSAFPAGAEVDAPFDRLQWKGRAIVITGPHDHEFFEPQLTALKQEVEGLKDRDIIVITFHNRDIEVVEELSAFPFSIPGMYTGGRRNDGNRNYLESQLKTDDDVFSVVLVGKDGETKKVWQSEEETPVSPFAIFELIDSMPMRQQEMRTKKQK